MESSKVTTRHIKQVASDPQVAQINLMWHQHADLPASKDKKKRSYVKPRPSTHKNDAYDKQPIPSYNNKNSFDLKNVYKNKERCPKCGDSLHVECFQCPVKKYQCKTCHKYGHFTSLCYQKKQVSFKPREPKAYMLQAGAVYACDKSICSHSENLSSSDDSFCLQVKIQHAQADCEKIPTPSHFITNLVYRLKPHHTRKNYLRARSDTCADVNIMLASMYKLVFKNPDLKRLAPSTLEMGTYTAYTVKIIGSCFFYQVPPGH